MITTHDLDCDIARTGHCDCGATPREVRFGPPILPPPTEMASLREIKNKLTCIHGAISGQSDGIGDAFGTVQLQISALSVTVVNSRQEIYGAMDKLLQSHAALEKRLEAIEARLPSKLFAELASINFPLENIDSKLSSMLALTEANHSALRDSARLKSGKRGKKK